MRRFQVDWAKLQAFLLWILGSLLAIALIGAQPCLALALVLAAGAALGIAAVIAYDRRA